MTKVMSLTEQNIGTMNNPSDGSTDSDRNVGQVTDKCRDYVETNFRYLAIGSPGPCMDVSKACNTDSQYDADVDPDSGDEEANTRKKQRKIFFGHDFRAHKGVDQRCSSRKKKSKETPAIKVDKCETPHDDDSDPDDGAENSSDSSSCLGSSPGGPAHHDGSLHSPPRGQFFLSPTPPMCRKVNVDSKTVIYYSPSLTCSRSEGCLREQNDESPSKNDSSSGIVTAQSLGVLK